MSISSENKIYFTITGTGHYFGHEFFEPGMKVRLVKEPDNRIDKEAIRVEMPGLGKCGYVANSSCTVEGESRSAGRIYDRIGDKAEGEVLYKLPHCVICSLSEDSLIRESASEKDEDQEE